MRTMTRSLTVLGLTALLAAPALAQTGTGGTGAPPSRPAGRPDRPAPPGTGRDPNQADPRREQVAKAPKPGDKAPDFTLSDARGREHSLKDYAGKIVVLQWINPDCPVCKRVMADGITKKAMDESKAAAPDVVWLFINSTNYMEPDGTAKYLEANKMTVPGLIDRDGKVGRLYNARTTPHIFVIDDKGILQYSGAIDDDERNSKAKAGEPVILYPAQVVRQIKAGESVSPNSTRPYGCSVKYADASGDGREGRGGRGGRGGDAGRGGAGGAGGAGGGGTGGSGGSGGTGGGSGR